MLANVAGLGAKACVVGVIGNDAPAGARLKMSSVQNGDYSIVDEGRPSTTKTRIIAHNQLVVRADREKRLPVNGNVEKRIVDSLKQALQEAGRLCGF